MRVVTRARDVRTVQSTAVLESHDPWEKALFSDALRHTSWQVYRSILSRNVYETYTALLHGRGTLVSSRPVRQRPKTVKGILLSKDQISTDGVFARDTFTGCANGSFDRSKISVVTKRYPARVSLSTRILRVDTQKKD